MIQLKTSLNKIEITYIENADFPLSIDGVHLHDSDINELYEFLKTQVYKDEIIHSVMSNFIKEKAKEYTESPDDIYISFDPKKNSLDVYSSEPYGAGIELIQEIDCS